MALNRDYIFIAVFGKNIFYFLKKMQSRFVIK